MKTILHIAILSILLAWYPSAANEPKKPSSVSQSNNSQISPFYVWLKVVIRNDKGEVLLVKDKNADAWEIPGNGWVSELSLLDGVKTAIRDETGVTLRDIKMHTLAKRLNGKSPLIMFFFSAWYEEGELSIGPEISDIKWVPEKEAVGLLGFDSHKRALLDSKQPDTQGLRYREYESYGALEPEDFLTF